MSQHDIAHDHLIQLLVATGLNGRALLLQLDAVEQATLGRLLADTANDNGPLGQAEESGWLAQLPEPLALQLQKTWLAEGKSGLRPAARAALLAITTHAREAD